MSLTRKFIKYLTLTLPFASSAFAEKTAIFCVDNNYWYPYLMTDEMTKNAEGALVDITKKILAKMNIKGEFKSTPWSRCTSKEATANGEYDGILVPSYKKARAEFMYYPPTAEKEIGACTSPESIVCAKYVFVITKAQKYEYDGNPGSLPLPIRAPRGYSVVADLDEELKKENKSVEVGLSDEANLQKLVRDGTGVAILADAVAKHLLKKPDFKDKLRVLEKPYVAKSNFVVFYHSSKNFKEKKDRDEFWKYVDEFNKDKKVLDEIYAKYEK